MTDAADAPLDDAPFLAAEPPPGVARGLSTFVISLFAAAVVLSVFVRVPETTSAPFVLVPKGGADPVRAPRSGTVTRVVAIEGASIQKGAPLFTIRSPELGDRSSELMTLEAQLKTGADAAANAQNKFESESLAAQEELNRLLAKSSYLNRQIGLKKEQLALTLDQAERARKLHDEGLASVNERSDALIRHSQSVMELEQIQAEKRDTEIAIGKLKHQEDSRRTEFKESERGLQEKLGAARIRTGTLAGGVQGDAHGEAPISSPCTGTVILVSTHAAGAVVREGEVLAQIACGGEELQAELTVPQRGAGQIRTGQDVKLMYDAFPYQRYGVKRGKVTWTSPEAVVVDGQPTFRVFASAGDTFVMVAGQRRDLLPGMRGLARVVVGRRSIVSYIFAPLHELRENLR